MLPIVDLPDGYKDSLYTITDVFLSLGDRIKVLFGWRLTVKTQVFIEHEAGKNETYAQVDVWRLRKSKLLGVAEEQVADSEGGVPPGAGRRAPVDEHATSTPPRRGGRGD